MQNLQECLNDIFDEPELDACPKCQKITKKLIYDIGDILFLETEFIFTSSELHHTINSSCPETILIRRSRYKLIGVVEIEEINKDLNHYRAYCLVNNRWIRKDDLSTSAKYIVHLPDNIKLSMVVYAKVNAYQVVADELIHSISICSNWGE
ncbi:uncharacterized protein LOC131666849 [Phymastichus coffea]|uniref:uncharacterized protein LOC131666849 n=1 Tax=Phymastichus coffea TaxID=108790 RepID=UPI00273B4457|nr:uncharacterized protein LOC131666849 [Phymastichus coffea]